MRTAFAALLGAVALLAAGCFGGGGKPQARASGGGAAVFTKAGCGSCHMLAAAGAKGTVGPSLDDLHPDAATVVRQVTQGGGSMPSFAHTLSRGEIAQLAAYVASSSRASKTTVAASFKPDRTKLSDCANGDQRCYQQAFANLAYYDGPKRALAIYIRAMATNREIESGCHRIAHAIGAGGLAHFHGNVAKAFAAGSSACWSGYYHGILERSFAGVPPERLALVAQRLCSDPSIERTTFVLYQCVHGLGHGLMIYTGYDLPRALHICHQLQTAWDQTSCTGGVFMENISTSYGVRSPWLRDDDPLFPCKSIAERDKLYCYLMATSRILAVDHYDWRKTAWWCRKSEPGWVRTCFQSYGRDASGTTRQRPTAILALCRIAGDMQGECIYGAARDMTSNYAGGKQASVLCNEAPARSRSYCFKGIGTIIGSLEATLAERGNACALVTRRYAGACRQGAGA
jgi:mono/diheme cytochrome c family protein